jgi:hypothetical protein
MLELCRTVWNIKFENSSVTENIKDLYDSKALSTTFILVQTVIFLNGLISSELTSQFTSYYQQKKKKRNTMHLR